ncbi:hypothetical protein Bra3105_17825 [Brachybacterium halotolerans subsp. kimchii]|uniref:hypothetical protein n=1 Tax=Brachybacterium halotolerans TaxID=2795215 RepID=UPI001E4AD3A0|nr:hypothetical protein [Brachybacterium halotolerans]UEJ82661.1 hypothetical protein Bra3105_17825 [Brachybacterium halotolerans subsp. kimchii]
MTLDDLAIKHIGIVVALLSGQDGEKPPARRDFHERGMDGWDVLLAEAEQRTTAAYQAEDERLYEKHIDLAKAMNAVPSLAARTREDSAACAVKRSRLAHEINAVMARRAANARALLEQTRPLEQLTIDDYLGGPA